jgi:hypothetical protein
MLVKEIFGVREDEESFFGVGTWPGNDKDREETAAHRPCPALLLPNHI